MENKEKLMSGEESLRIITDMINKTKVNVRQSSFHLLFWGWLILGCSLTEYLLWKLTDFTSPYYVWLFVIPGVFISMIYGFKNGRKAKVHTYADMLYMWTWVGFMIAAVVLFIVHAKRLDTIVPYILLLAGFPTFLSGIIIKFRPLITGGLAFWAIALVIHFAGPSVSPLGVPLAMLVGYLRPGYILRKKIDNDTI